MSGAELLRTVAQQLASGGVRARLIGEDRGHGIVLSVADGAVLAVPDPDGRVRLVGAHAPHGVDATAGAVSTAILRMLGSPTPGVHARPREAS